VDTAVVVPQRWRRWNFGFSNPSIMKTMTLLIAIHAGVAAVAQPPENQGPDAPDLVVGYEEGLGFKFEFVNPPASNNYQASFVEQVIPPIIAPDANWRFQGYLVFEVEDPILSGAYIELLYENYQQGQRVASADLNDTILEVVNGFVDSVFWNTCAEVTWLLLNAGTGPVYSSIDQFGHPYLSDSTYCFVALAFATNPYSLLDSCGTADHVLVSRRGVVGAIQPVCVRPVDVGYEELDRVKLSLNPVPTSGRLNVQFPGGQSRRVRCYSANGDLAFDEVMTSGASIDVSEWASGPYQFILGAHEDDFASARFLVSH
jgi:hypothetical protein